MNQYLSLFDAAGRLSTLRDAEFVAMLQLMGRTGAVGLGGTSGLLPAGLLRWDSRVACWPAGLTCFAGLLACGCAAGHWRCWAAGQPAYRHAAAHPAHLPCPSFNIHPHPPTHPPSHTLLQVFSPVQKARIAASSLPYFPDVVQLVRLLAQEGEEQHALRHQQQQQQQAASQQQRQQASSGSESCEQPAERVWSPPHLP